MKSFAKYCVLYFFFSSIPAACNNSLSDKIATFRMIDFTYDSGGAVAYSYRVDSLGHLIVAMGRWHQTFYIGKLNNRQLSSLDSCYSLTPFNTFDSIYNERAGDLSTAQIVISDTKGSLKFQVYGNVEPKGLKSFIYYLRSIGSGVRLTEIDTTIEFESRKGLNQIPPRIK